MLSKILTFILSLILVFTISTNALPQNPDLKVFGGPTSEISILGHEVGLSVHLLYNNIGVGFFNQYNIGDKIYRNFHGGWLYLAVVNDDIGDIGFSARLGRYNYSHFLISPAFEINCNLNKYMRLTTAFSAIYGAPDFQLRLSFGNIK